MSTSNESNSERMRELLSKHANEALASTGDLSAEDVIRRSRRRRTPRKVALGAVSTLAVAGLLMVAVPAVVNSGLFPAPAAMDAASTMSEPEREQGGAPFADTDRSTAAKCHEALPPAASSYEGLSVSVTAETVRLDDAEWRVDTVIELTNSDSVESRSSGIVRVDFQLTQGGEAVAGGVWHPAETPDDDARLAPGESIRYAASFIPEWCDGAPLTGEFELTVSVTSSVYLADLTSEPVQVSIR